MGNFANCDALTLQCLDGGRPAGLVADLLDGVGDGRLAGNENQPVFER